jgi:hypothetical protein
MPVSTLRLTFQDGTELDVSADLEFAGLYEEEFRAAYAAFLKTQVDYKTQSAELIFLTSLYRCREFPALAMKALACQPMSALTTIQLRKHVAAIKRLVFFQNQNPPLR